MNRELQITYNIIQTHLELYSAVYNISKYAIDIVSPDYLRVMFSKPIVVQDIGINDLYYPNDWWQAFKDRWFPKWAKKKWPVIFKHYKFIVKCAYPNIIHKEQHHMYYIMEENLWMDSKGILYGPILYSDNSANIEDNYTNSTEIENQGDNNE